MSPAVGHTVFDCIEAYAPGFKGSVVGRDILTPPDLERIFGLPGGVSMSLKSRITLPLTLLLGSALSALPSPLQEGRTVAETMVGRGQSGGQS